LIALLTLRGLRHKSQQSRLELGLRGSRGLSRANNLRC
jgi:hypothetical protein